MLASLRLGRSNLRANITTINNENSFKIKGTQVICSLLKVSFNILLRSTVKIPLPRISNQPPAGEALEGILIEYGELH